MEFDQNLMFNFASIFATILLLFVTFIIVFQRLKIRWPLKVNCWFCNKDTKIWQQQLDWWLCPFCEQYNGFSKNGDYSYTIPEQHKISLNDTKRYCSTSPAREASPIAKSNLCNECNTLEAIKLSQLSNFVPRNNRNYKSETEQFKQSLENKYPLCANCRTMVHNVLQKQSLWLAQYKMLFFKQKPVQALINRAKHSGPLFRFVSTVLASMIVYNFQFLILAAGGLFSQLCAYWVTPARRRRSSDILLSVLWISIILLVPFKDLKLLQTGVKNIWFSIEYITQYHMIMLSAAIITIMNAIPKSTTTLNNTLTFKRIKTSVVDTALTDMYTSTTVNDDPSSDNKTITNCSDMLNHQSSENTVNNITSKSFESSVILKKVTTLQAPSLFEQLSTSLCNNGELQTPTSMLNNNATDNFSVNDSLSTLSSLSLSEDLPKYKIKTPKVFEKKVYNGRTSDLFKRLTNVSSKKYILSPPKLKSVMQTSWVAGGYWQEGIDAPSLSRSSSQSSGFGSAGSNFAPSREPSVHEFDQCSVGSDAAYSCHVSRPNDMNSMGSLCQQNPSFSFVEPKAHLYAQAQNLSHVPHQIFSTQPVFLSHNFQRNNSVFTDQSLKTQQINVSDVKGPSRMPMFPSHTTIVTSPVWLPALLCGSLVLNIIVLCTMLLR
ncbi:hypothetical protein KM043_008941 [Ampulex compressa]|nr:hypothetical protein KM043_008941 [Ampulex compressa]